MYKMSEKDMRPQFSFSSQLSLLLKSIFNDDLNSTVTFFERVGLPNGQNTGL